MNTSVSLRLTCRWKADAPIAAMSIFGRSGLGTLVGEFLLGIAPLTFPTNSLFILFRLDRQSISYVHGGTYLFSGFRFRIWFFGSCFSMVRPLRFITFCCVGFGFGAGLSKCIQDELAWIMMTISILHSIRYRRPFLD